MWILIVSLGCNQDNKKKPMQITLPDTALTNRIDHGYVYSNQLRRELNLKDLRIGVDSFEFRIYEEFSLGTPDRLFIIKNENYKWKCSLYHYWTIRLEKESPMRIEEMISNTFVDSCSFKNIIPLCGWNKFIDTLNHLNLFSLPSQSEINGFSDGVEDGIDFRFEVATKERYKYYSYHCPEIYKDVNNKKATQILEFIGRQIDPIWFCNLH